MLGTPDLYIMLEAQQGVPDGGTANQIVVDT